MVGFIKGIFGAKQTAKTESTQPPEAAPKPQAPKPQTPKPQAFYLDSSDAKTLGDIDYMQAAREIKRSFPKTLGGEVLRTTSIVSSVQRSQAQKEQQAIALQRSQATVKPTATFAAQPVSGWTTPKADNAPKIKDPKERRSQDSSLDPFRAMARDIQKANIRKY
ncbi:hypothetical protein [Stenomitos frigidus]|uniref:Uncharacterized protein n=1 Tax=Stenomitos frigidus ULC18 TaxID=2107698 RepID=A0A2T1E2D6_9CYAN|nr:hypothetical protein [Stenomitos frigidus]PSB26860.1 hypothetical protein C7B82_18620 [Stenomitos frigidus ULC18]